MDCGWSNIVMQKWRPGFCPSKEKISKMPIWMSNMDLGSTIKVDLHTLAQDYGKYRRVCVEIDLTKPLSHVLKFMIMFME